VFIQHHHASQWNERTKKRWNIDAARKNCSLVALRPRLSIALAKKEKPLVCPPARPPDQSSLVRQSVSPIGAPRENPPRYFLLRPSPWHRDDDDHSSSPVHEVCSLTAVARTRREPAFCLSMDELTRHFRPRPCVGRPSASPTGQNDWCAPNVRRGSPPILTRFNGLARLCSTLFRPVRAVRSVKSHAYKVNLKTIDGRY